MSTFLDNAWYRVASSTIPSCFSKSAKVLKTTCILSRRLLGFPVMMTSISIFPVAISIPTSWSESVINRIMARASSTSTLVRKKLLARASESLTNASSCRGVISRQVIRLILTWHASSGSIDVFLLRPLRSILGRFVLRRRCICEAFQVTSVVLQVSVFNLWSVRMCSDILLSESGSGTSFMMKRRSKRERSVTGRLMLSVMFL